MKKWLPLAVLISSLLSVGAVSLPVPGLPYYHLPLPAISTAKSEWKKPAGPKKIHWEDSLEAAFRVHRLIAVSS